MVCEGILCGAAPEGTHVFGRWWQPGPADRLTTTMKFSLALKASSLPRPMIESALCSAVAASSFLFALARAPPSLTSTSAPPSSSSPELPPLMLPSPARAMMRARPADGVDEKKAIAWHRMQPAQPLGRAL